MSAAFWLALIPSVVAGIGAGYSIATRACRGREKEAQPSAEPVSLDKYLVPPADDPAWKSRDEEPTRVDCGPFSFKDFGGNSVSLYIETAPGGMRTRVDDVAREDVRRRFAEIKIAMEARVRQQQIARAFAWRMEAEPAKKEPLP